jgi:hypothetical protein
MTAPELKVLDDQLNEMIQNGQFLAAIERFYGADVEMSENGAAPTRGRAANLEREKSFFATVVVHEAHVVSQAIGDGVSATEWRYDWTVGGKRAPFEQVAVRRWQNGRVVSERFYYKG